MSKYHSDKCTKTQAEEFRKKVVDFMHKEGIEYSKIIALRSYNGMVKVFSGKPYYRMRLRTGRKLVAFKTPSGVIEGENLEAIEELKKGGDLLYYKTNDPIEEKEYFPVYREDDWEEEKIYLMENLKKQKLK